MQIIQAVNMVGTLLAIIADLSSQAVSSNGARLNAIMGAVKEVIKQAQATSDLIKRMIEQGRDELTDEEKQLIKDADTAAGNAQRAALAAFDDEAGETTQARRPGTSRIVASKQPGQGERSLDDVVQGKPYPPPSSGQKR